MKGCRRGILFILRISDILEGENFSMWIWPSKRFEIRAALPAREAMNRIAQRTLELQEPSDGLDDMLFMGEVEAGGFVVRPVLMVQNAFAPKIQGKAQDTSEGCTISVSMGLHKVTAGFMIFWFVLFGAMSILRAFQGNWMSFALSLFLFVFGYVWMALGFEKETRRDQRLLTELMNPPQNRMQP